MTRYRLKTLRAIEQHLREHGPMTITDLADGMGKERRVIKNYINTHKGIFEVKWARPYHASRWGLKGD